MFIPALKTVPLCIDGWSESRFIEKLSWVVLSHLMPCLKSFVVVVFCCDTDYCQESLRLLTLFMDQMFWVIPDDKNALDRIWLSKVALPLQSFTLRSVA